MATKELKDMWELFIELWELKNIKKIYPAFQDFRDNENPRDAVEKIISIAKENPRLDDLLKVSKTHSMILRVEERAEEKDWNYACQEALKEMEVNYEIRGAENIPKNGGALYISNHPYGLLDAAILIGGLGSLISKKERELKLIGMNQLRFIKGIEEVVNFVHSTAKGSNMGSVRKSLRYIKDGGDLAIYPSGGMSKAGLKEYSWKRSLGAFVSHCPCVVPMWFSGPNHAKIYNFLSKNKKRVDLKRIFSLREIWNKAGETVVLNIGGAIESEELKVIENAQERVQHLRDIAETLKVAV